MFSKSKITQSMIDAVNTVVGLTEKVDVKKRTTDTLAGRVKIPPTSGDNEHTDYKVELNAEETDKGESSTDAKGNKTTKYKDGSWQTETPTHKDDGKNPEGKVHHLSDVARRKMIKMNAKNEEVELEEVDEIFAKVPKSKRFVYGHKVSFHAHGKDIVGHVSSSNPTHAKVSVRNPEKGDPHNWNVPHKHLTMVHDSNKARAELTKEEVELDEVLDTFGHIKSYLDKSATKRKLLAATGKLGDDSHRKINKSFAGSDKAINKWNKKNSFNKEEVELDEKLNIQNTSMGDIIKDFQTSDAPQFAGKSQAKRRQMAIAAKMATEEYMYEENAVDKVTMDIPLLIRIMEYSKEDAKSDMDLHKVAENLVEYSKSGKTLTMACYNHVVGINEAKRSEDDSVPFITNEAGLSGHVNSIKKLVKHTFKKVKANESYYDDDPDVARADRELARMKAKPIKADRKTNPEKEMSKLSKRAPKEDTDELDKDLTHKEEFNLGESSHTERKKSFIGMLDRISAKAKENTKLQQNRKIEPKLPKKDLEESEKPTTAHFTDPKGIKRKQPNDPFYPEYDKHEQGKTSDAKKARFAKLGLKAEEVIDEAKKDSYQIYHPTYSSAVQHAEKHLNKQGFDIHPDDWFHHVNSGPSKPAEGKTVSLHIPLHKDGVPSKKVAHIQVYNRGNDLANNHELNMYHN